MNNIFSKKFPVIAMSAMLFAVPLQQSPAQVIDFGPIIGAIEDFKTTQLFQELQKYSQMIKDYEQKILEYKELVNQGITQAKQYKTQIDELQELYHQGKTFVTGDLPHFLSNLKADPLSTLNGYTKKLFSLARNADEALSSLKTVKVNVGGGLSYSLDELAGLTGASWYTAVNGRDESDGQLDEDAKAYAKKLTFQEKAFIQNKFHISAEDYYKWTQKTRAFKKSTASALASCTQWVKEAQANADALEGYAVEIAKMGMTDQISANEIGQMTNNLLYTTATTLQSAVTSLRQSQSTAMQSYAIARQEEESARNKKAAEERAWKQELDRKETKFGEDAGVDLYPPAPKNRGYPSLWGK